ncbi:helix-turn-helix domain-containing protein [Peribacillus deserti]
MGVNRAVFQNWVKQYEFHGEKAFEKSYTSYNGQFKLNVLNYMYNNGTSPNEAAAIFNIPSPGMIRKWRIQSESHGIDALNPRKRGIQQ